MFLAHVIYECEDAMVGDLAEYYGIYDYESLPLQTVATLVSVLRPESRVMIRLSGAKLSLDQMLMALAVDNLQFLSWSKTKNGQKGRKRPKSILKKLLGQDKPKDELEVFDSPEAYDHWMRKKRQEWSKNNG